MLYLETIVSGYLNKLVQHKRGIPIKKTEKKEISLFDRPSRAHQLCRPPLGVPHPSLVGLPSLQGAVHEDQVLLLLLLLLLLLFVAAIALWRRRTHPA